VVIDLDTGQNSQSIAIKASDPVDLCEVILWPIKTVTRIGRLMINMVGECDFSYPMFDSGQARSVNWGRAID
jgi:hypothetical protein